MNRYSLPGVQPPPPPQDIDWQPGRAGSVVFDRVRLEIDGATFTQPVTLRLRVPEAPPPIPEHLKLPYVFRVEARDRSGQLVRQLARPIRFTIDFSDLTPAQWGQTYVNLYYFDETASRWTVIPGPTDMAGRRVVADVDHFSDFGFGGDSLSLPSTPPNLEGFQVDLCTGYAQARIPLEVPPGTAGLTPRLELKYSSGIADTMNAHWIPDGNNTGNENTRTRLQASPVGFGWSLDLGAVFRSTQNDAGGNAIFYLVLNGQTFQLARVDSTNYRTKPDEYLRVRRLEGAPNESTVHEYWVVEAKDGTEYRFGYTANSEQRAGAWQYGGSGQQLAWQWSLDRIMDTHGNTIEIEYDEVSVLPNNGEQIYYDQAVYPLRIKYTGNSGQGFVANREITFIYSSRTDHATHSGYTYTQYYRQQKLDRIEMRVGGTLVRKYEFLYEYKRPYWHVASGGPPPAQVQGLDKLVLRYLHLYDASDSLRQGWTLSYHEGQIAGTSEYYKLQLKDVDNSWGAVLTYSHEGHTPSGSSPLPRRYRVKEQQITTLGTAHGVDSTIKRTYTYGTSYNILNTYDYRGHEHVTVTDTAGHWERSWFQTTVSEELQSRRWRFDQRKSDGTASFQEFTDWEAVDTQGGAKAVRISRVRQYQGTKRRKTQYGYTGNDGYDAYGNRIRIYEYDGADVDDSA